MSVFRYINISHLKHNVRVIKHACNGKQLCAVVKANAYGFGVENIVPVLMDEVKFFAVANLDEALKLRDIGVKCGILVLGVTDVEDVQVASKHNTTLSLHSVEYLKLLKGASVLPDFHLSINTGMNRFGVLPREIESVKRIVARGKVKITGIYTHFATGASDSKFVDTQYALFARAVKEWGSEGIVHCSSSYAALNKKFCEDMVRVGFALYGMGGQAGLLPVLSMTAKIVGIVNLERGETLGYDRTFVATKTTRVGVVAVGYADGLMCALSGRLRLFCGGQYVEVIGKVCMDVCFVDLTTSTAQLFDDVEIVGEHVKLSDYANALNTSQYEVLVGLGHARGKTVLV